VAEEARAYNWGLAMSFQWMQLRISEESERREREQQVLARLPQDQGNHPLLVTGRHGEGRTLVWTSDIGPHWLPYSFVEWPGYARLWTNVLRWVSKTV